MNTSKGPANGAFNYSQRTTTIPTEGETLTGLLHSRIQDGFATSAYWGATGEVPPREPDDAADKHPYPFQDEINRKLVPLPKEQTSYPRTIDYTHIGLHHIKDDGNSNNGGLNASQLRHLYGDGDGSGPQSSAGPNGSAKPRFLTLETTAQSIPRSFDDGVLKALRDGQKKEDDLQKRLADLKATPYTSGSDPDPYKLTSDDYCDVSKIDPSSSRQKDWKDGVSGDTEDEGPDVYRSRYNNVEREGPKRREKTHTVLQRSRNVDRDALKSTLHETHDQSMPKGYTPYSAKDWMSTTHREHAMYDVPAAASMNDRNATVPLRNKNYTLTEDHSRSVVERDTRFRTRNNGDWGTEYSDSYVDRSAESKVCKKFGNRSIFDIEDGIYTMYHEFHHPRADVRTGETYTPAEMVPGQYTTMSAEPLQAPNRVPGSTR